MMFADADWLYLKSAATPLDVSIASISGHCADVTKDAMKSHHAGRYNSTGVIHETAKSQVKVGIS